jgi:ComF family protein
MTLVTRASRIALDLLFPPRCALCDRDGTLLCDGCIAALPPADGPRCERCFEDVRRGVRICRACEEVPPAFASVRAPFSADDGARRLVHLLKYDGLTSLAAPMASLMAPELPDGIDVIVPVPLHRGRQRSRGYNQAADLARHLSRLAALPVDERTARRVRATPPLVKSAGRADRRAIMHGAFTASARRVEGRRVLLVDDVCTTGATLDASARSLHDAGARSVRALTFARA